ncbi:hypothetical protein BZA05DRAFT_53208 [Tricharina praecox]|uniref:uncharacterized protein n=1 Tax=Tricharina praecox TaxID=43433 RepID=UPI00221FDB5A|nr:uncharacterized protein BZA05DRAFT_53208 [Tricharina praecox]KAI5850928.1 hypothetical protein BZA05DRAFT_53208 [Tricharina praecox]
MRPTNCCMLLTCIGAGLCWAGLSGLSGLGCDEMGGKYGTSTSRSGGHWSERGVRCSHEYQYRYRTYAEMACWTGDWGVGTVDMAQLEQVDTGTAYGRKEGRKYLWKEVST